MQMQRDAEMRVREMQSRARKTVENDTQNHNRMQNHMQNPMQGNMQNGRMPRQGQNGYRAYAQNAQREMPRSPPQKEEASVDIVPPCREDCPAKQDGTIVGDILDALNLDEDVLLILGLILILLNQRADTTLILALAYLLI